MVLSYSVLAHISSLLLRTLPAIDYDNEHYTYDDEETEEQAVAESAANPAPQPVPPGKEPLPKTAEEFAAAALDRKPNYHRRPTAMASGSAGATNMGTSHVILRTRRAVTYTVSVDCVPPCQPGLKFPPHAVRLASPHAGSCGSQAVTRHRQ